MSFRIVDLMEGARNWVIGYGGVKKGDNVLVWVDSLKLENEPHLAQAYAAAAREAGASVTIIISDPSAFSASIEGGVGARGWPQSSFPPVLREAIYSCDIVIPVISGLFHWADRDPDTALIDYGVKYVNAPRFTKILASKYGKFPPELSDAIRNKQAEILTESKQLIVRNDLGSNLVIDIDPRGIYSQGDFGPGCAVQLGHGIGIDHFVKDANGICVFDAPPFEQRNDPMTWVIEHQRVVDVKGAGSLSGLIKNSIAEDPNLNITDNLFWSTTPGPSIKESIECGMVVHRGGTVSCAMGSNLGTAWGNAKEAAKRHGPHAYWWRATVHADNACMVKNGYVTAWADDDIRKVAAKYGDPDVLLPSQDSYPW